LNATANSFGDVFFLIALRHHQDEAVHVVLGIEVVALAALGLIKTQRAISAQTRAAAAPEGT
jgi:hypothetical protein